MIILSPTKKTMNLTDFPMVSINTCLHSIVRKNRIIPLLFFHLSPRFRWRLGNASILQSPKLVESAFKLSPVRRLLAEVRICWEGVEVGGLGHGWMLAGLFLAVGWMVTGVVDINSSWKKTPSFCNCENTGYLKNCQGFFWLRIFTNSKGSL